MTTLIPVEIDGFSCEPKLGSLLRPDNWASRMPLLRSDWEEADFVIESARYIGVYASVRLEVTSRKITYGRDGMKVRVRIIFVRDGEPNEVYGGWMWI